MAQTGGSTTGLFASRLLLLDRNRATLNGSGRGREGLSELEIRLSSMSPAVGILGRLLVRHNEAAPDLDALREREIQLLALLAIRHGHVVPTEEIAELLFGHLAEDRAVANVRVSVSRLRKTLGDGDLIVSARHGYQLAKHCEVDVELFEECVADGRAATVAGSFDRARSSFEEALALYRGDLAEGLRAEWIDGGRQRLRSLRSDVFDELADAYVALARPREAADVAERAISLEPTRESAYRRLMTARYAAGEQDAALAAYARCRQVLSDELGVDPLPETMRLHERIVRGEPIAVPGKHGSARTHRAFVARDPDRITLDATIARAASECVFALVLGEPGAGKTRLVDEVLRARSDVTVVTTRCFALERDMPFQPLREALGDRAPSAESAGARGDLVARYARALISEAHGRPLVWSIDDIQWADVSTVAVFHHVALRMPTAQVAIVATGRSEDLPPEHPVIGTLTELRRQQRGDRLALAPLSLEDVTALARAHHVGIEQARSIYTRSGGNAFFATELLALARRGDRSLPPTARDAALARSHLPERGRAGRPARSRGVGRAFPGARGGRDRFARGRPRRAGARRVRDARTPRRPRNPRVRPRARSRARGGLRRHPGRGALPPARPRDQRG